MANLTEEQLERRELMLTVGLARAARVFDPCCRLAIRGLACGMGA